MSEIHNSWNVFSADQEGERLDQALARMAKSLSRSRIQKLILDGHVLVNEKKQKANHRLSLGDSIRLFLPAPKSMDLKAQDIPLHVLYQDEHLAVLEKPAGLVVHPAVGHEDGTLVNALLHLFPDLSSGSGIGGNLRPGIVHRIDKNTSGILLVTKTDLAHQDLSQQFKLHTISRKYLGLCWGALPEKGEWNDSIGRDPKERKRMAPVASGKKALTKFKRLENFTKLHLFEAELFTGRTHQIRVHFAHHGLPLVGDSTYGAATGQAKKAAAEGEKWLKSHSPQALALIEQLNSNGRQFLHAKHLGFIHPVSKKNMLFESELPSDLSQLVLALASCRT